MKKLKANRPDLRRLLLRASSRQLLLAITRPGRHTVDELIDVFMDVGGWDDQAAIPERAMRALFVLGATEAVTTAWTDLVFEFTAEDGELTDEEFFVGNLAIGLGEHADPALAGPVLLDILDEMSLRDHGWTRLLEPLVHFGERGWHDERTWMWLERLRAEEPDLWCSYVDGYGDVRAIPLLHELVDAHTDDDRVVIEALAALETYAALRPKDLEQQKRLRAQAATLPID